MITDPSHQLASVDLRRDQLVLAGIEPATLGAAGAARISTTDLDALDVVVTELAAAARSANTRRAYAADWGRYVAWATGHGLDPAGIDTSSIIRFATAEAEAGYALATVRRRAGSLSAIAQELGRPSPYRDPSFRAWQRGLTRTAAGNGRARQRQATALTLERLAVVLERIEGHAPKAVRDRAVLLVGFWALLRRSEGVGIDVEDLTGHPDGLLVHLGATKTDDDAVAILPTAARPELCPVRAVRALREALEDQGHTTGPLFRSVSRGGRFAGRLTDRSAARAIAGRCEPISAEGEQWSGHSLRRGGATSLAQRGATVIQIERAGRWAPGSPEVRRYVELADAVRDRGLHLLDVPMTTGRWP